MALLSQPTLNLISDKLVSVEADGKPALIGGRCAACSTLSFPRAEICPTCLSEKVEAIHLSSEGELYSYTVVHQASKNWNVPYVLGYVDLPEGIRVLAHIDASVSALVINQKVTLSLGVVGFDAAGAAVSTYTFVPA